jgi:hypothetical protein
MSINIQSLFADIIDTPEQRQQKLLQQGMMQGQLLSSGLTGLARGAAPLAQIGGQLGVQRNENLRRAVQPMLGIDPRTTGERLQEQLRGIDTSKPAGLLQAAQAIQSIDPVRAAALRQAAAEATRLNAAQEAEQARAKAAVMAAESGKINAETARTALNLDQSRLDWQVTDTARLRSIQEEDNAIQRSIAETRNLAEQNRQTDLSVFAQKTIDTAVSESNNARSRGLQAMSLAKRYEIVQPAAGFGGTALSAFNDFLGTQGDADLLKREFNGFVNNSVMLSLPPGAASDSDVALARSGYPDARYNAEQIQKYLNGVAKSSAIVSEYEKRRAEYISKNKGNQAGFLDEWNALKESEEFIPMIEKEYKVKFNRDAEESPQTPEAPPLSLEQQAEAEKQRRQQIAGRI